MKPKWTEEEFDKGRQSLRWLGLTIHSLDPYMTPEGSQVARNLYQRLWVRLECETRDRKGGEWPDDLAGRWAALR